MRAATGAPSLRRAFRTAAIPLPLTEPVAAATVAVPAADAAGAFLLAAVAERGLAETGRMRAGECAGRSAALSPSSPPGDSPAPAPPLISALAPFPVAPPTLSDMVPGPGPVGDVDSDVRALPPLLPDHGRRFRADHAEGAYGEGGGGIKGTGREDDCGCECIGECVGFLFGGGGGLGATPGSSAPTDPAGSSRKWRGCRGGASCPNDNTPVRESHSALQQGHQLRKTTRPTLNGRKTKT